MTGNVSDVNNLKVLKGKIRSLAPYALDTTLSVEGVGAEAQATGKAIDNAKAAAIAYSNDILNTHAGNYKNPHKVTKAQVGLENVDNTSDADKPVSAAQQRALNNKVDIEDGKMLSSNDFTDELKAKLDGIEEGASATLPDGAVTAEKIADGAVSAEFTAAITVEGWTGEAAPYTNAVTVTGITADDKPFIDLVASEDFATAEKEREAWGMVYRAVTAADTVTFYATEKPTVAVNVQIVAVRK